MMSEENSRARASLVPLLGFLALILLLGAVAAYLIAANAFFWMFLIIGLGALAAFGVLNARHIRKFFVSRQARYGANVAISLIGFIGIAVIVNIIVSQKFDRSADWTSDKLYTLSDQTKNILRGLDREVKALAFFSDNPDDTRLQNRLAVGRDMLGRYARETDKLEVEFIDPVTDPQTRHAYGIEFDGTVVFESGQKRERVTAVDEQKFTSAIMKVVRDEIKRVYFLVGHEERGIDVFDAHGYQQAKEGLERQNYAVETLALATVPDVPPDCGALVIAAPKTSMLPHEVGALSRYLKRNGKLLLMFEPSIVSAQDPNQELVYLMDKWGVTVANDYVLVFDPRFSYFFVGPAAPMIGPLEFHDVTRYVQSAIFQTTRSVTPKDTGRADLGVKSLAKTPDAVGVCWGETARGEDGALLPYTEATYTEGADTPPPVSIAVVVELGDTRDAPEERMSSEGQEEAEPAETRNTLMGMLARFPSRVSSNGLVRKIPDPALSNSEMMPTST